MGMIAGILGLPGLIKDVVGGFFGTVNGVTKALSDAKIASIKATTAEEKIHADERVISLQAQRDLMVAEANTGIKLNAYMRAIIAAGPASVLLKIFFWDKVIGSFAGCSQAARGTCGIFVTDPLDAYLWGVITVVVGFYFLTSSKLGK